MSERGSFITEYVYCPKCFQACREILLQKGKYHHSIVIPSWEGNGKELPIIAGKLGGFHSGVEVEVMEKELKPLLDERLCHLVRIVVIPENGSVEVFLCGREEATP